MRSNKARDFKSTIRILSEAVKLKFVIVTFLYLMISVSPAHSIVNGSPAVGSDYVVTMLTGNNSRPWCTGAYLRPLVVVTAAHCVTKSGARTPELIFPLEDWYVSQPGIDVLSSEAKSSKVKVRKIWTDPDYFNRWEPDNGLREGQVNDIAFLFLEKELNGPTIARAASRDEIESFRLGQGRAFHLGYGCIGVNGLIQVNDGKPYLVEDIYGTNSQPAHIPIRDRILSVKYPNGKSICPGDSGSPLLMKNGDEVIYMGTIFAGGNFEAAVQGIQNLPEASVTVLWPFVSALEEQYKEFLIENSKPTAATPKAKLAKSKTIKCTKGKLTKKVSGKNPKCPSGYKRA